MAECGKGRTSGAFRTRMSVLMMGLMLMAGTGTALAQDEINDDPLSGGEFTEGGDGEMEPVTYDIVDGSYSYNIISKDEKTVKVMAYEGMTMGAIEVPGTVTRNDTTFTVTAIGDNIFMSSIMMTGITLPETVTSIGEYTFQMCMNLPTVKLPSALTSIGTNAFFMCSKLSSIELPAGLTSLGNSCFASCMQLTSINFPEGLTTLSEGLFSNTGFTSITIPSTVKTVGPRAFSACNSMTSAIISAGVESVDATAFANSKLLTDVYLESTTPPAYAACVSKETVTCEKGVTVHVPAGTLEAYKASDWATYAADIVESTTGIDGINASSATATEYYSLGGQRLKNATKGVNVVKMSDGSVRKVVK